MGQQQAWQHTIHLQQINASQCTHLVLSFSLHTIFSLFLYVPFPVDSSKQSTHQTLPTDTQSLTYALLGGFILLESNKGMCTNIPHKYFRQGYYLQRWDAFPIACHAKPHAVNFILHHEFNDDVFEVYLQPINVQTKTSWATLTSLSEVMHFKWYFVRQILQHTHLVLSFSLSNIFSFSISCIFL